jgi:hypothetical protein
MRGCSVVLAIASFVSACTNAAPSVAALTEEEVDTGPWLRTVTDPQPEWSRVIERRTGVLRHRFVRFRPPQARPSPRARFVVRPFADTRLVLRPRRAGPVLTGGYSWFGAIDGDPRGWGGLVARSNGRVSASLHAAGRHFEVLNVEPGVYAVLELRAEASFQCGAEPTSPEEG